MLLRTLLFLLLALSLSVLGALTYAQSSIIEIYNFARPKIISGGRRRLHLWTLKDLDKIHVAGWHPTRSVLGKKSRPNNKIFQYNNLGSTGLKLSDGFAKRWFVFYETYSCPSKWSFTNFNTFLICWLLRIAVFGRMSSQTFTISRLINFSLSFIRCSPDVGWHD